MSLYETLQLVYLQENAMRIQADAEAWLKAHDAEVIVEFVAEVEQRAEAHILKTGKLEGAHYCAMTQIMKERRALKAQT